MLRNPCVSKARERNPRHLTHINQVRWLSAQEIESLTPITESFAFRANEYYLSLINWDDPNDPIRKIIIPDGTEPAEWGDVDPSQEEIYVRVPGLEHKYTSVAVVLTTPCCGGYCRFCFRKRIHMKGNQEMVRDLNKVIDYIRAHREISEVLLTGGDPLVLSTDRLDKMVSRFWEIPHIRIVRIGTKMPAFNPYRILDDPALLAMFKKCSSRKRRIYIMSHFNHPRELTDPAIESVTLLMKAGATVANQTPLIRGVNDTPEILVELFQKLSVIGVPPYYVFQCRPAVGNKPYVVPIEEGYRIFETAKSHCSGLSKRARFVMSHSLGKIEVIGLTESDIIFKFHRAHDRKNCSRIMVYKRNPQACWLDDYSQKTSEHPLSLYE